MNLYTPKDRNGKTFHVGDLVEIGEGAPEEFHGDKARVNYVVRLEDLPQLPVHSGQQAMLSQHPMLILDEEDGGTSAVFANTITILEQGDGEELVFEETPQPSAPRDIHGREIKAGDTVRIAGKRVKQDYQGRVVEVSDPTPTIERIALINPELFMLIKLGIAPEHGHIEMADGVALAESCEVVTDPASAMQAPSTADTVH